MKAGLYDSRDSGRRGEAYARESDLIRMGFLQLNVIYSVQLASGSYAEVGELDRIISQTNDSIETYEDKDRLSCALTSHYEGINLLSGILRRRWRWRRRSALCFC